MSTKAEFYRALGILCHAAGSGDRRAEAVLGDFGVLVKNVLYALEAGDKAHAAELLADAMARAMLRQALG